MSILYIVSTPIGNLGDVTARALEVLRSVDRVLAEDTRRTGILLRHFQISTRLVSAHEHNEAGRAEQVVSWLDEGETLALVSDAGTPLLSDPGARIVERALAAGHEAVPIPGASALLAALVAAGTDTVPFTFFGFPPRGGTERTEFLTRLAALEHTAVLYESPGRLIRLLQDLQTYCGADRHVAVARELTKLHETFVRGTLGDALAYYEAAASVRGEVVVVLAGATPAAPSVDDAAQLAASLVAEGMRRSAVVREVARRTGLARNEVYAMVLSIAPDEGDAE